MAEEPLKDLFQCYWRGCFLSFLIIDFFFPPPPEWVYTLAVWHRGKFTKHSSALEMLPALGPTSVEGERQTCLESKSRIRAGFKTSKSYPDGTLSARWQEDRRLKSPGLKPAFVDSPLPSYGFLLNIHLLSVSHIPALLGALKGRTAYVSTYLFFLPASLSTCGLLLYLLPTLQTLLWGQKTHHFPICLWDERVGLYSFY